MNPVYTGKDVSYIDTKQAQRAIETAVSRGRAVRHPAWLDGAPFPHAALDKAWRLLAYGAHHDGITGVESDQVYLDLLGGWREAWELSAGARRDAVAYLSAPGRERGAGRAAGPGVQRAGAGAGADGHGHRTGAGGRDPVGRAARRGGKGGAGPGRGRPAAGRRLAGRGHAHLPGPRRAGPRIPDLPGGAGRGGRPGGGRAVAGGQRGAARHRERPVRGHRGSGAGRDGQRHRQAHPGQRARRARATSWSSRTSTRSIPGTARARGICRPRGRAPARRRSWPRSGRSGARPETGWWPGSRSTGSR